ncbi:MAG TPA: methyltransferase domain-containing protein [Candidatus Binatia bacterium]
MAFDRCFSAAEYFELVGSPVLGPRWALEHYLASQHRSNEPFGVAGVCDLCARPVLFAVDFANTWTAPDGVVVPNWRESMTCPECRLNGRQRMIASLVRSTCADLATRVDRNQPRVVYIAEQATPFYRWCMSQVPLGECISLIGSEYFDDDSVRPNGMDDIRHEDAERLSLGDASIDLYVSCDVLEHVNDPSAVLREVARVVRPGGRVLLTFPLDPHKQLTTRRARKTGRVVEHFLPPTHHLDPCRADGALVYHDFGWDVLEEMRSAGVRDAALFVYWSDVSGYLGIQFYFAGTRS